MQAFTNASQAMMGMAVMGEQGAKLAGSLMKFVLAPYRAGRELDGAIDEFIDAAPQMAARMGEQNGEGDDLAEANKALAEAERSEEHTSELQSLMRRSYAGFCLKKKNEQQYTKPKTTHTT